MALNELFLYDEIGGWGTTASMFAEQLAKIPRSEKDITVRINSPGGDIFAAVAIMNLLRSHPARVVTIIDGIAASAATFVAMAGDEVKIASNGIFMIHNAMAMAFGDAGELREVAGLLDKIAVSVLVPTYRGKTGLSVEKIKEYLDAETWFSSEEAIKHKFVDSLSDTPAVLNRLPARFAGIYHKIPDPLKPEDKKETEILNPSPKPSEEKEDFIKRCMADDEANKTFPDSDQRYAFCQAQWKKSEKDNTESAKVDYSVYQARLRLLQV